METPVNWAELLIYLSEPFPTEALAWRAGAVARDKKRAQALPYADSRQYEDRLNTVCPGDWSVSFKPWGEHKLICELTIHGVTRSSTGEFEDAGRGAAPKGTAAEAQAFKRACVKFGLGRYLYDVPVRWVDYDEERKRLLETPEIPKRFLPEGAASGSAADYDALENPETLTPERAENLVKLLESLGVEKPKQLAFATFTLQKPVAAFTELPESEAVAVYRAAQAKARQKTQEANK